jgi:hypothetical protein
MDAYQKIKSLNRLLENSKKIINESSDDSEFKVWKTNVERTFLKIFGEASVELKSFKEMRFFYNPQISFVDINYTSDHLICFREDFKTSIKQIESYIEECTYDLEDTKTLDKKVDTNISKVFISHASKDKEIVEEIIELLEVFGLDNNKIFCTSFEGYGIPLGENFLEKIKHELDENVLVVFVLTNNFYNSPVCLCEMGATWVKTSSHIPVLVPPFDYSDIKGVIGSTQGFKLNEPLQLNLFKDQIIEKFGLQLIDNSAWERKRDRILKRINDNISEPQV